MYCLKALWMKTTFFRMFFLRHLSVPNDFSLRLRSTVALLEGKVQRYIYSYYF